MTDLVEAMLPLIVVVLGGIIALAAAVWFGLRIAPRIGRAADRADADHEVTGDEPD